MIIYIIQTSYDPKFKMAARKKGILIILPVLFEFSCFMNPNELFIILDNVEGKRKIQSSKPEILRSQHRYKIDGNEPIGLRYP